MKNWIFSHCFALKVFPCRVSRRFFFEFKLIFCSCLFVSLLFFKWNFWEKLSIFFWTFDNIILALTLFSIYRHEYSFSSNKKWLFSEGFFLFSERRVHSKNKQLFCQIFPFKPFLISTLNPQAKNTKKKKQIWSLHKCLAWCFYKKTYLGLSLWFTLFWEPHKPSKIIGKWTKILCIFRKCCKCVCMCSEEVKRWKTNPCTQSAISFFW